MSIMFVIFIVCVLQIDFSKGNEANQMPPRLLEMSLKHVNTLLADIDDKIAVERELLSQIDDNEGPTAYSIELVKTYHMSPNLMVFLLTVKEFHHPTPYSIIRHFNKYLMMELGGAVKEEYKKSDWPGVFQDEKENNADKINTKVRISINHWPSHAIQRPNYFQNINNSQLVRQAKEEPNLPPLVVTRIVPDLPGLGPEWPFDDPISPTITALTTTMTTRVITSIPDQILDVLNKSPIRKSMVSFMKEEKVKYTSAFAKGLCDTLAVKTDEDLNVILVALGTTLLRMSNNNQLKCAGELLVQRFKEVAVSIQKILPSTTRNVAKGLNMALKFRLETYPDGLDILKTYDEFFNSEEGNNLLDIVVAVHNYNSKTHGKPIAETLSQRAIEAFSAPVRRQCGSPEVEAFLKKVNDVYETRFLSMRAGPDILSALIESNLTSILSSRRSMSKNYGHMKSEYKKMIRHYMLKHPNLFRTFAKHYKRSEERKHRQSKHKKHHRRHRNRKHKHHNNKKNKKGKDENIFTSTTKKPHFRVKASKASNAFTKIQKRYSIVDDIPKNVKKILLSSRRLMKNNQKDHFLDNTYFRRNDISIHNQSKKSPSTKKSYNNKILERIIADSSYSDDEIYIKTMLKDAYFHSNYTIPTNTQN